MNRHFFIASVLMVVVLSLVSLPVHAEEMPPLLHLPDGNSQQPASDEPQPMLHLPDQQPAATPAPEIILPPSQPVQTQTPPSDEAVPPAALTNPPPRPNVAQKPAAPLPPPEFNRSLMFKQDDYDKFTEVFNAFKERMKNSPVQHDEKNSKVDEILGKLRSVVEEKLPSLPPAIYLNSILYHGSSTASAWINGAKFNIGDNSQGIKLLELTPYTARIQLQISNYSSDFKTWADTFSATDQPARRRDIKLDPATKTVDFVLRPNQRLDTEQMSIREGKPITKPLAKPADKKGEMLKKEPGKDEYMPPKKPAPVDPIDANELINKLKKPIGDDKHAEFKVYPDGHFYVPANLNQQPINFKVDTGATVTAISSDDAQKIGVDTTKLNYSANARLADGSMMKAAPTTISDFAIGDIKLQNVSVLVAQGKMAQPLLGMSVLSKLKEFSIKGDTLSLSQ